MYISYYHREEDYRKIVEFMRANEFATLVAYDGKKPVASHLLMAVIEEENRLVVAGHMAKANSLWKLFERNEEVLLIFQGPHTYISATWYNHVNVPTWNYQSVHAYGHPELVTDHDEVFSVLSHLIQRNEANPTYRLETLPQDFVEKQMNGIMAFRVEIARLEAAFKLSQNRNEEDYQNVIIQLEKRPDEASHQVAQAMRENRKNKDSEN